MKGTYLENYLESVATLPSEIRRNFALLRELDSRSQESIEKVEDQIQAYVRGGKKAVRELGEEKMTQQVAGDLKACLEYADEKVALAVQTYELIDKHIRRLDQDLRKFEAEMENAPPEMFQEVPESSGPGRKKEKKEKRKSKDDRASISASVVDGKRKGKEDGHNIAAASSGANAHTGSMLPSDARVYNVDADMPIDPNEPTYCFCNRVSFGEMVGCDNADCKVEWFHFECVGLTNPPKGKWYCPDCMSLKKKHLYK